MKSNDVSAEPSRGAGPDVVAILGPTASGKSALGLELTAALGGEIACCDSMQVYRGMDVGTGKSSPAERAACPHHLLDVVEPDQPFHAAAWADHARRIIDDMAPRGSLPVIVGGTGLYFRALVKGLFQAPPSDAQIRARHQERARLDGVGALHTALATIDKVAAAAILPTDLVRISRALEIFEQTGMTISDLRRTATPARPFRVFAIILDPPLDELRVRIAARVDTMMADGFLDEVTALRARGFGQARALQSLGYRQLGQHLDGTLALPEAVAEIKRVTTTYARRQRTWFRKETATLRLSGAPDISSLLAEVRRWRAVAD